MFSTRFVSEDKELLERINYDICQSLAGYPPFKNDEVFVSCVDERDDGLFEFDVLVGTEETTAWYTVVEVPASQVAVNTTHL